MIKIERFPESKFPSDEFAGEITELEKAINKVLEKCEEKIVIEQDSINPAKSIDGKADNESGSVTETDKMKPVIIVFGLRIRIYYYFDPQLTNIPAYRNAVWIEILDMPGVWIRVQINGNGRKKSEIWSKDQITAGQVDTDAYSLPPFDDPGIYKEVKRVTKMTHDELVRVICKQLRFLARAFVKLHTTMMY